MLEMEEVSEIIKTKDECETLDYKKDLVLALDGDKAEFVKDIVSLANSSKVAYIIIGVQDKTRKLVGRETEHTTERLNDILKNKCDPPISIDYAEHNIFGHKVGVIEIRGNNPPYIISVIDRYGGQRTQGEPSYITRGMLFTRNKNKNEGAVREHIEKMYEEKVNYITLQADLALVQTISSKPSENLKEVNIEFKIINSGDVLATSPYVRLRFENIEKIVSCKGWENISGFSNNTLPTILKRDMLPVFPGISLHASKVIVQVAKSTKQINTYLWLGASNMRVKKGSHVISLSERIAKR